MDSPGMCGEGPVLMESHQTPGVPTSLSPEPDSTSREDLSCSFISVLSDVEFFGFCPKFDQKLHGGRECGLQMGWKECSRVWDSCVLLEKGSWTAQCPHLCFCVSSLGKNTEH